MNDDTKATADTRKKSEEEQFLICPVTGKLIWTDKAAEDMKV